MPSSALASARTSTARDADCGRRVAVTAERRATTVVDAAEAVMENIICVECFVCFVVCADGTSSVCECRSDVEGRVDSTFVLVLVLFSA